MENKATGVKAETTETVKEEAAKAESEKAVKAVESKAKESDKKATIAIVLAVIALIFLAGSKFIVGAVFFYSMTLILAVAGFIFAYKTTELNKKAILAIVLTATPMVISGYNLFGIAARDAFIDFEFHRIEDKVTKDVRGLLDVAPETKEALEKDYQNFKTKLEKEVNDYKAKVKEDAANNDAADAAKSGAEAAD